MQRDKKDTLYLVKWKSDSDPDWINENRLNKKMVADFNEKFYPSGRERRIIHV